MNDTPSPTRRQVLRASAFGAGAAVAGSLLPPSLLQAIASPPQERGGLDRIKHVVLLMQENRSFDHYYGRMKGVRGFGDRSPLRRRTGKDVISQPGGQSEVLPFSLREAAKAAGRPPGDIQYLGALPHGFPDATDAWAQGWWDGWVPAKGRASMTYYDRIDVPLQYELAGAFTTLDAYHCSVYGSTNPNRNFFFTGTTGYEPGSTTKRAVTNAAYGKDHKGYEWTTYPERLEAAGVSWQIYQEWDNFTDNPVEYFASFKKIGTKALAAVEGTYRTTEEFYEKVAGQPAAKQQALLAQLDAGVAKLSAQERSLFRRALYRSRPGTLVDRIRADIAAGALPKVVWVVPPASLSEHPSASTPVGSAGLIYDLLDVVASDNKTWNSTAVLLNFDENDGFFDHVPPPIAPRPQSGNSADWFDGRPVGPGPRVPMTIVSPWTVGGYVDSTPADHTSALKFLERVTGVKETNISTWRREVLSDLTEAFDWNHRDRYIAPDRPGAIPAKVARWSPSPPSTQRRPTQEAGRSKTRPVPQRPSVSGAADARGLRLKLANGGEVSTSFTVYPFKGGLTRPTYATVAPRRVSQLEVPADGGRWDVVVQGPNRFWAEFAGSVDGAARALDVRTAATGSDLRLELVNAGRKALEVRIEAKAYGGSPRSVSVPAGGRRTIRWRTDRGWYDVAVTVKSDSTYLRRQTGHVDNGRPSVTA